MQQSIIADCDSDADCDGKKPACNPKTNKCVGKEVALRIYKKLNWKAPHNNRASNTMCTQ